MTEALQLLMHAWCDTQGQEMSAPDLRKWEQRLEEVLPPPGLSYGAGALLIGHPGVPLHTLGGAEVLGFGTRRAPWRGFIDVSQDPDIVQGGAYGEAHNQVLTSLGHPPGLGAPRIILLWGNSD